MHIHGGDIYTYQNMLDFSANINPLGIPESVVRAAAAGAAASASYPDPKCRRLKAAIAAHEQTPEEYVVCGNGAADLIFQLALAAKPRRALLLAPGFHEYEQALRTVDCQVDFFYLKEEDGFRLADAYLEALTPGLDIVFLCNPNNPTGLAVPRPALLRILEKCRDIGARLVMDECFNEFLDEPAAYSLKPELSAYPNLFILKAFTKIYAMPGLRLGYGLCADQALLAALAEAAQPWSVSIPAQEAGLAALTETEYVARAKALVKDERERLQDALAALGCRTYGSMANYIFFRSVPGLAEACRAHNLLLRDCSNYQGLCPGYFRAAVKLPEQNNQLLAVLTAVLAEF
ncbi:MAG TPA: aminotransferase class I/II-fold pyridoxal phosphate-dependent enzyme [Candidatus Avidehalobacter gallistercoris]|uniref:Aminotransferase class I/II-fold pyridoxal phosphate-dependent enzyme n=1 Tax=Candidatus Avidehalobacter gallistercoris TaxID=2840694 RepID=A0A9D1KZN6_9FIRM|nr:aminotransferase class I/II-fold pyridoxal phosphate-dependent enzyme [Candidatus Avidehalobacter gallistercoris]